MGSYKYFILNFTEPNTSHCHQSKSFLQQSLIWIIMIQNQSRAHFQSCHWRLVHYGNPDRPFYAGYFVNCDQIQPTDSKIIFWLKKSDSKYVPQCWISFSESFKFQQESLPLDPPKREYCFAIQYASY